MDKIQLALFFLSGFLVSRLLIKAKVPERVVFHLMGRRQVPVSRLLLYLVGCSSVLSIFIPNTLTALTLLPIIELLRRPLQEARPDASVDIATMMGLALIYGANIGGMGSLTATPANGILIGFMALRPVPGSDQITFETWLMWGLPLVIVLTVLAWVVLMVGFQTWRYRSLESQLTLSDAETLHPMQPAAYAMTFVFFASSIGLSIWMQKSSSSLLVLIATGVFTAGLIAILFLWRISGTAPGATPDPLLTIPDTYSNLPTRGIAFVIGFMVIAGTLVFFGAQRILTGFVRDLFPAETPFNVILLGLAMLTSFSTEVLSNTVVQVTLFTIAIPLAEALEFPALYALFIITLSSTCAFMSPAATAVNALAFGEIKALSLRKMLLIGLLMNLVGALVLSAWVPYITVWFYV